MDVPTLQWSAAEVRNGTLTVPVAGDRPKGWKSTFDHTVRLLGGGSWGEVSLRKTKVKVGEVTEGTEDELRFFLRAWSSRPTRHTSSPTRTPTRATPPTTIAPRMTAMTTPTHG